MTMVDITRKDLIERTAVAEGRIILHRDTITAIRSGDIRKGDPYQAGEIAAMLAVKSTPSLLPHCHPIPITSIDITFSEGEDGVTCRCEVKATYRTGVEMEALAGVCTGLLTVWDMVKYREKDRDGQYPDTVIRDVRVIEKIKEGVPREEGAQREEGVNGEQRVHREEGAYGEQGA
jgi:cyclic pyranopterin phosphate synthase